MQLFVLLILSLLAAKWSYAQPAHEWEYISPATWYNSAFYGACSAANGDYILVGTAGSGDSTDIIVERISAVGEHLWTTRVMGSQFSGLDTAVSVYETPTAELKVIASLDESSFVNYAAVITLSASGNVLSTWRYGGENSGVIAYHGIPTFDGNTIIAGYRRGLGSSGDPDGFILKKRADGDTLWARRFVMSSGGMRSVVENSTGGYYAAGHAWQAANRSNHDFWLARTDSLGQQEWLRHYGTNGHDYCVDLAATASGELYLAGRQGPTNSSGGYILKVQSNGDSLWSYGLYSDTEARRFTGIAARPSGGCYAVGSVYVRSSNRSRFWVVSREATGISSGEWMWDESATSALYGILPTNQGGWIVVGEKTIDERRRGYALLIEAPTGVRGQIRSRITGLPQRNVTVSTVSGEFSSVSNVAGFYALELSPGAYELVTSGPCVETGHTSGVIVPEGTAVIHDIDVGVPHYEDRFTSLNLVAHNDVESAASIYLQNTGSGELYFIASVENSIPNSAWLRLEPNNGTIQANDSALVNIIMQPDTSNSGAWEFQSTIVIRSNSCPDSVDRIPVFVTVLDVDHTTPLVQGFRLFDAYPNPFNATTTIRFELPLQSLTELNVFDIQGREVAVLINESMSAGSHQIEFNAGGLATGLYFYRLQAGEFIAMGKFLFLK